MSLHNNSDFEIISNAEVSSVIRKYSPDMIDLSFDEILKLKNKMSITPMANMISAYENSLKMDMAKYPQFQNDMLERRTELYTHIIDKACTAHELKYVLPSNVDIYTAAQAIYQFLISGYYESCISFFTNLLMRESKSIVRMINVPDKKTMNASTTHSYISYRYTDGDDSLSIIHMNMNETLDVLHSMDFSLEDIIKLAWGNSPMFTTAELLSFLLYDTGKFYNFYLSTIDANRAEVITDIRLRLMPTGVPIKKYIEDNKEDNK